MNTIQDQPQNSTVFVVDQWKSYLLGSTVAGFFESGTVSLSAGESQLQTTTLDFGNELGKYLYLENGRNISKTMDKYAAALSHAKITMISVDGTTLQGKNQHAETFVHVAWPCLIFPAGIVLLSAAL